MTDLGPKDRLILRRSGYEVWYHKSVMLYVLYRDDKRIQTFERKRDAIAAIGWRCAHD